MNPQNPQPVAATPVSSRAWSSGLVLVLVALACLVAVPMAGAKARPSGGWTKINGGAPYTSVTAVTIDSSWTGVNKMRFCNAGGSYSSWEPYAASKSWTLPDGDGLMTVYAQYKTAGKATTKTAAITVDTTPPVLATVTSSSHPDEAAWYASPDATVDWIAAQDLSGVVGYSWTLDADPATDPDTVNDGPAATATLPVAADGVWYVHVRALDAAGNWGVTTHRSVRVDTAAPSTSDDYDGILRKRVTFALTSSDSLSGVAFTEYRIDDGSWHTNAEVTVRLSVKHRVPGFARGAHIVEYRSTDAAGNVEPAKTCIVTL